jgi:hypothetical protein
MKLPVQLMYANNILKKKIRVLRNLSGNWTLPQKKKRKEKKLPV